METRAMAISFFYAVGTAIGGITGPLLFGRLIEAGGETNVMYGYLLGAALMVGGGRRRDRSSAWRRRRSSSRTSPSR